MVMLGNKKINLLDYSIYFVLLVLIIIFSLITDTFLSVANMRNFFSQIPTVGIITLALTMILISGSADLSIASIAAFTGTMAVYLATLGWPILIIIPLSLITGSLFGLLNSILMQYFDLQPFILTLGTNYMIRGAILFATNGTYIRGMPDWFYNISNTKIFGTFISTNTLIFVLLIGVISFVMNKTKFGRYCYAVGSNREAARLSGININLHFLQLYMIEGAMAALAGILLMSNLNVGAPSEAVGLDFIAISAAIMGGVKFGGGVGKVSGAIAGLLTIQVFQNGLAVMGVNTFLQQVVMGMIIVVAMLIDYLRKIKRG